MERQDDNAYRETALYGPVKELLERRGYAVKGEVNGCDLVARRGDEPPVVVELKLRFTLALVLQGIDRLALTERVYLAVPRPQSRRRSRGLTPGSPDIRKLCRRLGLGLILVGKGNVEILEEPVPYRPRPAKVRALRLKEEFDRRIGDANVGGTAGVPLVTAYRQDALRCARALALGGPMRIAALRAAAGVPAAARVLQRNVYGWFTRVERGTYALSCPTARRRARSSESTKRSRFFHRRPARLGLVERLRFDEAPGSGPTRESDKPPRAGWPLHKSRCRPMLLQEFMIVDLVRRADPNRCILCSRRRTT